MDSSAVGSVHLVSVPLRRTGVLQSGENQTSACSVPPIQPLPLLSFTKMYNVKNVKKNAMRFKMTKNHHQPKLNQINKLIFFFGFSCASSHTSRNTQSPSVWYLIPANHTHTAVTSELIVCQYFLSITPRGNYLNI